VIDAQRVAGRRLAIRKETTNRRARCAPCVLLDGTRVACCARIYTGRPYIHTRPAGRSAKRNARNGTGREGEWALPRAAHSRSNAHFTRAHHFYITPSLVVGDQRSVSRWEIHTSVSRYDFAADPKWSHTTKCFEYQVFTSQVK